MLNLIKTIEMYQNFQMDEIHVTLKKSNMDKSGPTNETSCNKGKIYTKKKILKMVNITHKQKHCKEESIEHFVRCIQFGTPKSVLMATTSWLPSIKCTFIRYSIC
jgi:hypothetical protein